MVGKKPSKRFPNPPSSLASNLWHTDSYSYRVALTKALFVYVCSFFLFQPGNNINVQKNSTFVKQQLFYYIKRQFLLGKAKSISWRRCRFFLWNWSYLVSYIASCWNIYKKDSWDIQTSKNLCPAGLPASSSPSLWARPASTAAAALVQTPIQLRTWYVTVFFPLLLSLSSNYRSSSSSSRLLVA